MKVNAITFLRWVAAVIVVIYHFGRGTRLANLSKGFLTSGPAMVSFFFVLSGFVLTISYISKENESNKKYYIARIARIAPIYYLALLIVCLFDFGVGNNNLVALILNSTFLQAWIPAFPLSFNYPAWSLSVEVFFYLLFPYLLHFIKHNKVTPIKFVLISVAIWGLTQIVLIYLQHIPLQKQTAAVMHDLMYYFPAIHICSFLIGVSGGYLFVKIPNIQNLSGIKSYVIMGIAFFGTYLVLQNRGMIGCFNLVVELSFLAPMYLCVILSIAYSKNIITKILSLWPFVLLGESSYGLYILQVPIHEIYWNVIGINLNIDNRYHFYIYFLLLISISVLSFYFIENPARKIIIKIASNSGTKNKFLVS